MRNAALLAALALVTGCAAQPHRVAQVPEVRADVAAPKPDDAPAGRVTASAPEASQPEKKAPLGWQSGEAFDLAEAALKAMKQGNLDECMAKNKESIAKEDRPRTRVFLGRCEQKANKYIDALKNMQVALELSIKAKDTAGVKIARPGVQDITRRMPHVTFLAPQGVTMIDVRFDDHAIPLDALTKKLSVDPAKHHVSANGLMKGFPATFEADFDVKERQLLTVRLGLKATPAQATASPPPAGPVTAGGATPRRATPGVIPNGQLECLVAAKNDEEARKCAETTGKSRTESSPQELSELRAK